MIYLIKIDRCAEAAYRRFLESVREFAPPLATMQPGWERMPEAMKKAWRNAVEAAVDSYHEDDAAGTA